MSGEEQGKGIRSGRWIIMGIALGLVLIAGLIVLYLNYNAVDYSELNKGEWKQVRAGIPYIQFESPVPLENKSRPAIGQEREAISRSQSFVYENGLDLHISASIVEYLPHVYLDPEVVVTSVRNFDKQFGASNISLRPMELMIGAYKAIRVDGSFTVAGRKYVFSRVNSEYRNIYRDLLVIVRAGDEDALQIKNRMVQSVFLEPQ